MSAFVLKIIAMITMLIDHIGGHILNNNITFRVIGRIAFVLYAFMGAEGMRYTSNRVKYLIKVFVMALLAEIPFNLQGHQSVLYWPTRNVLFTIFVGLFVIFLYQKISEVEALKRYRRDFAVELTILGVIITNILSSDYRFGGVPLIVLLYFWNRKGRFRVVTLFGILSLFVLLCGFSSIDDFSIVLFIEKFIEWRLWRYCGVYLAMPLLLLYDGSKGWSKEWFRYLYWGWYPLHMSVLVLFKGWLNIT